MFFKTIFNVKYWAECDTQARKLENMQNCTVPFGLFVESGYKKN